MVATNFYLIKWIQWKETSTPIVTQNINGPCPLIAIINILLLTRKITFSAGREYITSEELMENLVNTLLTLRPKVKIILDYDQNVNDAISSLSVLETGVDINVKFGGINQFEWTCNLIVFDLLDINLYHGWLVDPQNQEEKSIIGNRSYNELVEMIISSKSSNDSSRITEGLIAEQFLNSTASQLTYHGLYTLYEELKPEQLCVLFRNNHYSTLYKHKDELFILVTDIGYSTEKEIVWETLSNIEGDSSLVNHEFKTVSSQGRTENFDVNQAAPVDEQRLIESDINNGSTNLSIQYDPNNDRVSQEKLE
ncbi:uncharacterized protein TRIADDRAFT_18339 [Trichoplax adhaerens]|uniref:Ubiquitin carboxyl-terminal hydrolase n=1 Tax=Trichoplax adhaerens TaxID=10228 RepID=B3RJP5_TRIAD|nr:hypothetical protein TRIADDRAFT_18339 [Trichoplax adhaerens]EDV29330.1 hypothetical protein TRIADDRAFT_18339 [Trichoplax adhaerens]|eukprot:XP_002108532.1 hypothetical protein TRIADDRAFT_18339 [Trichoplax adhaerens]